MLKVTAHLFYPPHKQTKTRLLFFHPLSVPLLTPLCCIPLPKLKGKNLRKKQQWGRGREMLIITILFLAVLFLAGFTNLFSCFPTKRFYAWFQSLFGTKVSPVSENGSALGARKGLSDQKREELKRVFATFDRNSDGFITKQELRESLNNIGITLSVKDVEEMVEKVDANEDGLIDPDEFCELYDWVGGEGEGEDGGGGGGGEKDMKEAFDVFDGDGDGKISVEELRLVLSTLGLKEGKRVEDCKEMIKKVDMDGDGMVNFEEFKKMMKAGGKRLLSASS